MKTKVSEKNSRFDISSDNKSEVMLSSWNDGAVTRSIVDYVKAVTNPDTDDFIEVEERIAVFDNDGTLWTEFPIYVQFQFLIDRIKSLYPKHPEWKDLQPYKGILEDDLKTSLAGGLKAVEELIMSTHAGMTVSEFNSLVKDWTRSAVHPHLKKPYTQCIYQPMLELMAYLRANKFKTFIVSGGGVDFMRPWVEEVYGIPPEQVIGSSIKLKYELINNKPELVRLPEINFVDDHEGKPVGIQQHIGRIPVIAFGNSDGDIQMLEWVSSSKHRTLSMLLHHDDAVREFAYDRHAIAGKLVNGLEEAVKKGWGLISMKNDWKEVF